MKIGVDKKLHVLASAGIAVVFSTLAANALYNVVHPAGTLVAVAYIVGLVLTLAVGVGKEVKDRKQEGNHFCWKDLVADAVGAAVGSAGAFAGYLI